LATSLVIFSYFQFLDLLTTVVFILNGVQEANPVVKFALRAAPTPLIGLLLIKVAAVALAFYCWRLGRTSLLLRINVLFAVLVSWNLIALIVRAIA
jgi:Domain of unknown function (DUF5658)